MDTAPDEDFISVWTDSINHGIGKRLIFRRADALVPAVRFKLSAENDGTPLRPGLDDFKQVVGLPVAHRREEEFVNNQEVHFLVRLDQFQVRPLATRDGKRVQQVGYPHVPDGHVVPARGHAKGVGQVGLATPGGTHDDDVMVFPDVPASGSRSSSPRFSLRSAWYSMSSMQAPG